MTRTIVIPGEPLPMPRPRAKSGVHVPKRIRSYLEQVAWHGITPTPFPPGEPLAVRVDCYRATRRACDVDNLAKSILDGLQRVAFGDDRDVFRLTVEKHLGCPNPRAEVSIRPWKPLCTRCAGCGCI
jgi:crossover junction endodeoxyribonuclease RusA